MQVRTRNSSRHWLVCHCNVKCKLSACKVEAHDRGNHTIALSQSCLTRDKLTKFGLVIYPWVNVKVFACP
jgi:hypothetical protein